MRSNGRTTRKGNAVRTLRDIREEEVIEDSRRAAKARPDVKPYAVMLIDDGTAEVEVMSFPFTDDDGVRMVYVRTVVGDCTSAQYIELGRFV